MIEIPLTDILVNLGEIVVILIAVGLVGYLAMLVFGILTEASKEL